MAKRRRQAAGRATTTAPAKPVRRADPVRPRAPRSTGTRVLPRLVAPPLRGASLAAAAAVTLLAFVAYVLTIHPSLPTGDSGELISAAYGLGVAHPPGYPLYTMIGHLATLLPIGSPALRMNLLSAALDAVAVGVVFVLIFRLVGAAPAAAAAPVAPAAPEAPADTTTPDEPESDRRPWAALVAAAVGSLLLAFSPVFWSYSVVAEVFPLNNLFAALLLLVAIEWERWPETRLLFIGAVLFGLALTNQQTIILLAPALLVLGLSGMWRRRRTAAGPDATDTQNPLRPRNLAIAAGLFLVGLLPYAYLPLAAAQDPLVNWGDPQTLERFVAMLARADYGTFNLVAGDQRGSVVEHLSLLMGDLTAGFVVGGIVLAALGLVWAWFNRPGVGLALVIGFVVAGPVFIAYANVYIVDELTKGVIARFYILPAIPLAILSGMGARQVLAWAALVRRPASRPGLVTAVAIAVLLALPVVAAAANVRTANQAGNEVALHYAEDLLGPLEPNALLLMRSDENYNSVFYAQDVLGIRPDVAAVDVELLKLPSTVQDIRRRYPDVTIPFEAYDAGGKTSLAQVVEANIAKRPIYYVGVMEEEDFAAGFDEVRAGLARRLVPKDQGGDGYQALRDGVDRFTALRFPDRDYPATSWEAVLAKAYGGVATDLGYALQTGTPPVDVPLAEKMFRTAIRLAPDVASNYKNFGLLLHDNGGNKAEVVRLWEHFLELEPDDPAAPAIQEEIGKLKSAP